jgi:hypothetical protein
MKHNISKNVYKINPLIDRSQMSEAFINGQPYGFCKPFFKLDHNGLAAWNRWGGWAAFLSTEYKS